MCGCGCHQNTLENLNAKGCGCKGCPNNSPADAPRVRAPLTIQARPDALWACLDGRVYNLTAPTFSVDDLPRLDVNLIQALLRTAQQEIDEMYNRPRVNADERGPSR